EPFDATNAHRDHRITKFRVTAGDDKVTGPCQHQTARDAFAMHFRDRRFRQITPASGDLQVNLLLAGKPAMSIGFAKTAPASDRRKIDAGGVLGARAKIVPGREMRTAAGEDDDL